MTKRCLVLVEGQTEERFVKDVLAPAFYDLDLSLSPTILVTKRLKSGLRFKGGVTNYAKFRNDVGRLLRSDGAALVTSLVDYYGLPPDFPGMANRPIGTTPLNRVTHVEQAIWTDFGRPANFVPFLALHEFEAWLFSSTTVLPSVMTDTSKQPEFAQICLGVTNPEDINETPMNAPSKRIGALFPGYRKTLHGPLTAARIGIDRIRAACPHFDDWLRIPEHSGHPFRLIPARHSGPIRPPVPEQSGHPFRRISARA